MSNISCVPSCKQLFWLLTFKLCINKHYMNLKYVISYITINTHSAGLHLWANPGLSPGAQGSGGRNEIFGPHVFFHCPFFFNFFSRDQKKDEQNLCQDDKKRVKIGIQIPTWGRKLKISPGAQKSLIRHCLHSASKKVLFVKRQSESNIYNIGMSFTYIYISISVCIYVCIYIYIYIYLLYIGIYNGWTKKRVSSQLLHCTVST